MMQPACPIAVIGIGCLFPGSRNAREFWNTIVNGVDCIGEVPETHWSKADYFDANPKAPDCVYCTRGGFLPEIDFDPAAFGIPPANLDATDTSQLLGLVVARAALEDAGYLDRPFDRDKAAVILGVTGTQELTIPLASRLGHPHWRRALAEAGVDPATAETVIERIAACYVRWQENSFPGLLGNVVAGRIANRLDLRGPNCVVDAACASSLAALNLALQELEGGRSDLVITGGVDTLNDIFMHMCFSQSGLLSKTGDIRPFSAEADGTLLGEGIGMVVLKRLADAQRDGDRVYAVIRGLGASSDGKSQSIYAPRVEGQVQALRKAYEAAGIDPTTVGLIEAHGTGTRVGDRVEVEALRRVYCGAGKAGSAKRHVLGSVKSQIGHTKAAAGAAGLIKAVLSLHHKVLPPTIKVDRPDPELGIDEGPFELNTATRAWLRPPDGPPRRAAVSSFGFGGSNFHVVLEEADPKRTDVLWDEGVQIVAFSAADRSDLSDGVERWVERAASCPERLPVLAEETRRSFRADGRFRLLAVVRTTATDAEGQGWLADLRAAQRMIREGGGDLEPVLAETVYFGSGPNPPKLGILFPGQGSQKPGMAKDWFVRFPSAFSLLEAMGTALSDPAAFYDVLNSGSDVCPADLSKRLGTTDIAQPAIGAVSIGMWSVLHGFGVSADVFCGHSYGELCALHAAGRIERDAFIRLSVARGRWMAEAALQSPGGMIAVLAEESVSKDLCRDVASLVLANRNAPRQQVFSGPLDAIERAKLLCDARGVRSVRLPVSAAFHSPAMRPAVDRFLEALRLETIHPSERVVLSNADGKPFPDEAEALRLRLADQIASTVDFVSCIQAMRDRGIGVFLEVGPKTVLSGLVREMTAGCGTPMPAVRILSMDRGTGNACMDLAHVLCSLAAAGYPVVLDRWNPGHPRPDETHKPAMSVRICGANYRHPQTFPVANAVVKPFSETTKPKTPSIAEPMSRWSTENPMQPKPVSASCSETPSWHETLQQGIRSIEAIQRQTAELHQQFLATQAEAMRLVQQILSGPPAAVVGMSDNELRLTEVRRPVIPNSPGTDSRTVDSSLPSGHRVQAANGYRSHAVPKEAQEANDRHPATSGTHRMSMPPEADCIRETSPMAAAPNACTETVPSIASVLLDVVSRLTGYPVDVLGLDMDIEADLGIDSIKRVEILSAMEEAVAGLVVPAPDEMAGLKTLRQIVERLNGSAGSHAESPGSRESMADGQNQTSAGGLAVEKACCRNIADSSVDNPRAKSSVLPAHDAGDPSARILSVLLESVSRLTGYPVDVLGLDMDIEADLGIDSIKRVEILAAVEEALPDVVVPAPDVSAGLRTLRQIADQLCRGKAEPNDGSKSACHSANPLEREASLVPSTQGAPAALGISLPARRIVRLRQVSIGERDPAWDRTDEGVLLVVGMHPDIQGELAAVLSGRLRCTVEALSLKDALERPLDVPLRGLVLIAPPAVSSEDEPFDAADEAYLIDSLALCARHAASLQQAASSGPVVVAGVSFLDGGFGFRNGVISRPVTGGIAGLMKTAAREWPGVRCFCLDVDPTWTDEKAVAVAMADVLTARWDPSAVELGISAASFGEGVILQPVLDEAAYPERDPACDLRPGDVVLVSGGARGVAASVSIALTKAGLRRIVLLGRSPDPVTEPSWLAEASDLNEMRQTLVQRPEHAGMHPKEIDRMARRWLANREVSATLNAIRSAGADVLYRSVDVTDREAVQAVFQEVSAVWGPVSGMVHAAGVLADRLIAETSVDEVRTVLAPKLQGLRRMLEAVSGNPPRWIALFSSVAGRMGNRGQAAYAMANEAMNKTAHWLKRRYPDLRVISLNWGPWNGGMVTDGLKRLFQQSGVPLIEIEAGAAAFLAEIGGAADAVEVVIGGDLPQQHAAETETRSDPLRLSIRKEIDVERYPVLNSHVREGVPVVPFSLVTEWLGYGALHEHPGLFLSGLEEIRLLKGICLQHQPMTVRLMTGKPVKRDRAFVLDVEIRDGMREGRDVVHTRGKAVLTGGFEAAPDFDPEPLMQTLGPYARTLDDLYGTVLVHGKDLRGIRRIIGVSHRAMAAELLSAPHPETWMSDPIRKRWLADPLVLDGAFQMAAIWCYEYIGMVCQPIFAKRYHQYRGRFPEDGIMGILEVRESRSTGMVGDIVFLDADRRVVARFEELTTTAEPDACP